MAHLLPFRFVAAFCLSVVLLLSGCCANDVCDCEDEQQADAIKLRFKMDADTSAGGKSFGKLDLDTIIVQRSPRKSATTAKPEIVTLIRAVTTGELVLNNNMPFPQVGTTKLNAYKYTVQYLVQKPRQKPVPTSVLVIDSVRLRGDFSSNGCCTCYNNTEKSVFLNGARTEKDLSGNNFILIAK